jgi:hypothetical protein
MAHSVHVVTLVTLIAPKHQPSSLAVITCVLQQPNCSLCRISIIACYTTYCCQMLVCCLLPAGKVVLASDVLPAGFAYGYAGTTEAGTAEASTSECRTARCLVSAVPYRRQQLTANSTIANCWQQPASARYFKQCSPLP